MSVENKHPEYTEYIDDWELIDDIHKGEKAVKAAGIKYLPKLGGQLPEEYTAYKLRGSFFNAFARTVQGLVGFVFRKPTDLNLPQSVEKLLPSIMSTGQSYESLEKAAMNSTMKYGRVGLLVDADGESNPYVAVYEPSCITNWAVGFVEGEEVLTLLVLKEYVAEPGKDVFSDIPIEQYRSLELTESGVEVKLWRKSKSKKKDEWAVYDTQHPEIRGKKQTRIMFYFIGAEQNTAKVNKPPLIDMAYVNIDHWRLSVDYHHGLHFCSLPTPWAAGFDDDADLTIGPVRAWKSDNENASCGYLEFTGQGLTAVKDAMDKDEEIMAILGARVIENTRNRIETAEAARIRQSGESGALTTVVGNVSEGMTDCFKGIAEWIGADDAGLYIKLNTDFIDTKLTPQELTSLLAAYQSGGMSLQTFLYNCEKGELLPPDQTIEDEMLLIEEEDNKPFKNPTPLPKQEDDDDEELDDDGNPVVKDGEE